MAAIAGALLAMLIAPHIPRQTIIQTMLANILKAEILEKPGRSYPRRRRHGNRGKGKARSRGKGDTHAQYRRRKQRRAEARQRHPD